MSEPLLRTLIARRVEEQRLMFYQTRAVASAPDTGLDSTILLTHR